MPDLDQWSHARTRIRMHLPVPPSGGLRLQVLPEASSGSWQCMPERSV